MEARFMHILMLDETERTSILQHYPLSRRIAKNASALFLIFALGISIAGCRPADGLGNVTLIPSTDTREADAFEEFCNTAFFSLVSEDTFSLHFSLHDPAAYGISVPDPGFSDLTADGLEREAANRSALLKKLHSFSRNQLNSRQQLIYDSMEAWLSAQCSLDDYPLYPELLSPSGGLHLDLPVLLSEYVFNCREDVDDYLALLELTDTWFMEIYDYEKRKCDQGLSMNDAAWDRVIDFCMEFSGYSPDHLLISSFQDKIHDAGFLTDQEKEKYLLANETAVKNTLLPSYRKLGEKLKGLKGFCTNELGLAHFPEGRAYYTRLVRQYTGREDAPYYLFYQISEQRVSDLSVMTDYFTTNPTLASRCASYQYESADPHEMLSVLRDAIASDFPSCTEIAVSLDTVDDALAAYTAPAFYLIAPMDDYRNNVICYNPSKVTSGLDLFTTIAHEGFPGHMYQTVMSYEAGLEPVRCMLSFPGYTEGWATYVEMISYEYAGMDPSLARVLQLNYSITLSLYASADIGIHYYGWDLSRLTSYFTDYGITNPSVISEIYQMILWEPGNYLKYYVGYLSFLQLKQEMMQAYPESFSLYEFHKCIVETGPTTFPVLKKQLSDHFRDLAAANKAS